MLASTTSIKDVPLASNPDPANGLATDGELAAAGELAPVIIAAIVVVSALGIVGRSCQSSCNILMGSSG